MDFERKNSSFETGRKAGFIVMYLIFTTILYLILHILNKLNISYLEVIILTALVVLFGKLIQKLLK